MTTLLLLLATPGTLVAAALLVRIARGDVAPAEGRGPACCGGPTLPDPTRWHAHGCPNAQAA